ncbi:UNVERIFIED_CONTAM: hypothetical protein NCL1_18274 [Trichonephila clavipes]
MSVILFENSPLNAIHEWQYYMLNYQTVVQICSHCVWDNPESAPAVIGNCSPDHDSRYVNLAADSLIAGIPWCPSDQHTAITGIKAEPAFIKKHYRSLLRPPMSSDVTPHSLPNNTAVC